MTTKLLRSHGLALVFGLLFIVVLALEAISGLAHFNDEQVADGLQQVSLGQYLLSSSFAADVAENWQSEYLQFTLYIYGTVWLLQKGSPESKELGKAGTESDEDQMVGEYARPDSPAWAKRRGWRLAIYSRSLGIVMGTIFLLCWLAQAIAGRSAFNEQQLNQREDPVSFWSYLGSADFWNRTTQNWQSELLAVFSMVVLAIYLRQRGSPESKPVGAPHSSTGIEG